MKLKKSNYCITSNPIDDLHNPQSKIIIYSTRTEKGLTIAKYTLELLQQGNFISIPDKLFILLMYYEIVIPKEEVELEMIVNRKKLATPNERGGFKTVYFYPDSETEEKCTEKIDALLNEKPHQKTQHISFITSISNDIERGLSLFSLIRQYAERKTHEFKVNHELNISATNISRILELLPLSNPGFEIINFIFQSNDENASLPDFLKSIISCFKYCSYFKQLKVNLILRLGDKEYLAITDSIQLLKTLMTENVKINITSEFRGNTSLRHFDETELKVLKSIKEVNLNINYIPKGDSKYFGKRSKDTSTSIDPFYEYGSIIQDNIVDSNRMPYNDEIAGAILSHKLKCSGCVFLPMCGGRINKNKKDDKDCPPFTRNFMEKVRLLYKI